MLARAIKQADAIFGTDNVVVAFPLDEYEHFTFLKESGVNFYGFIGDVNDVVGRFYSVASMFDRTDPRDLIVRWTPDDWRKDSAKIRYTVGTERLRDTPHFSYRKYYSVEESCEVFTLAQLCEWHWEGVNEHREHIGDLLPQRPAPPDDGLPWSIDTQDDYDRVIAKVGA